MVIIQGYLAKVGITADIEIVDQGKYTDYRRKGWKNGFLCQPFGSYPNYLQSLDLYMSSDALDFPDHEETCRIRCSDKRSPCNY